MPNPNLPINAQYNTYIGARYVPKFVNKENGYQWDSTKPYEPLSIVLHEGNSYTSTTFVPIGADITNQMYWAQTGNYNAQVESYRELAQGTATKLNNSIGYVTPEMFGAVHDGVTNDGPSIQQAIDYAYENNLHFVYFPYSEYYVSETINAKFNVSLFGTQRTDNVPRLIFPSTIDIAINTNAARLTMANLHIVCGDGYAKNGIAISMTPDSPYDMDAYIDNITIVYFGTGVYLVGKNMELKNSLISHCGVGVEINVTAETANADYRGVFITENRFHNCGFEEDYVVGTSCIKYNQELSTKVNQFFISDNYVDLGTTFFSGNLYGGYIQNNYVVNVHGDAIIINNGSGTYPGGQPPVVQGNYIGTTESPNSEYGINITGGYRTIIKNNYLAFFSKSSIFATSSNNLDILDNIINANGSEYNINLVNCNYASIVNNSEVRSATLPAKSVSCTTTVGETNYIPGVVFGDVSLKLKSYLVDTDVGIKFNAYKMGGIAYLTFGGGTGAAYVHGNAVFTLPKNLWPVAPVDYQTPQGYRLLINTSGVGSYESQDGNTILRGTVTYPCIQGYN